MRVFVETPSFRTPERDYILGVILGDFLGLAWKRVISERADVRIRLPGHSGEVRLPDELFTVPDEDWLSEASMPLSPLACWDSRELAEDITLVSPEVPVIYGFTNSPCTQSTSDSIALPIDIFGSAFFMLSRYEELVRPERDEHDRFPASASVAFTEGFLERPIVDEYVEVLWTAMRRLWPQLKRRKREPRIRLTHDVDRPARYSFGSLRYFARALAGDVFKRGNLMSLVNGPRARYGARGRLHPSDPYNTFDWLMDVSEKQGITSAFYFIPSTTKGQYEPQYDLTDAAIQRLIKHIYSRGHEVGLHPGYNTYRTPLKITDQADRLRDVCRGIGVTQQRWGGRMHYLQWATDVTPDAWEYAGMEYDSTLGYADHAGFRCGTSHDFYLYSWRDRRVLNVIERPLITMDGTLFASKYMDMAKADDVTAYLDRLRSRCGMFGGCFNVLWHNSELYSNKKREGYKKAVLVTNPGEHLP